MAISSALVAKEHCPRLCPMRESVVSDMVPVLMELRRAVREAQHPSQWPDPSDWRCSRPLNVVRAYALLVRVTSEVMLDADNRGRGGQGVAALGSRRDTSADLIRLLKAFPSAIARDASLAKDRGLVVALRDTERFADDALRAFPGSLAGAFLGEEWRTPVPGTFRGMLSCLMWQSTPSERAESLRNAITVGVSDKAAAYLDGASRGIASATHLAQTCDDRATPQPPVDGDLLYRQAALVRVLCAHRLLLEAIGVQDCLAVRGMFGLAEDIAKEPTYAAFHDRGNDTGGFLASRREACLSILETSGRVPREGKEPEEFSVAKTSEKAVLAAMRQVILSRGHG